MHQEIIEKHADTNDELDYEIINKLNKLRNFKIDTTKRGPDFMSFAKKLGVKVYATTLMINKHLNNTWYVVQNEMIRDNIRIENIDDMNDYLKTKIYEIRINELNMDNIYYYQIIYNKLNEYKTKFFEFQMYYNNLILRIKKFAEQRNYKTISELKKSFDYLLKKYKETEPPKKIAVKKHYKTIASEFLDIKSIHRYDGDTDEWFVISRYICDYLEDMEAFENNLGIKWKNPIF